MSTSDTIWPRLYLLKIYEQAVANGHVIIHPISEPNAASLRMSLYRLRRRSDAANATFILPEYHLVTVGKWVPERGGTLHILYNSIPDMSLPNIEPAEDDGTAMTYADPEPRHPVPTNYLVDATEQILEDVSEITPDQMLENLRRSAAKRIEGEG